LNDPDYYALELLGEILGGGFSSRLFKNVRSDLGLAYAAFGAWGANYDYPGLFFVGGETKSESTVRAIKAFIQEVEKITQAEVTDEELQVAKDAALNSFIFNFDTKAQIVERLLTYEYYGYPKDFLMRYKENVEKVTKADILRVAKQHVHPDNMVLLVVGNEKEFDQPLATLGSVQAIDITIPAAAAPAPVASAADVEKGKNLLSAAFAALGGDKLLNVKDIVQVSQATINSPQGEVAVGFEGTIVYPNKIRQKVQSPMGEIVLAFDGTNAWVKTPNGTQNLPDSQKDGFIKALFADTINIFKNVNSGDATVQFVEEAQVDGKKANVLLVSGKGGESVKLFIDPTTNLPIKKISRRALMGPPADVEEQFSDFREISGIRLPFKITTLQNGKKAAEGTITEVKINTGVDPKLFAKE
jgi:outer membrane lipoprotein-sorting protein